MAEKPHEMLPRGGSLCSRVHLKENQDLQLTMMCDVIFEFVLKMGTVCTKTLRIFWQIKKQQPKQKQTNKHTALLKTSLQQA